MLTTVKNFQWFIPPTPSLPYTPNEKTLAYYPFRDDIDDQTQSTTLSLYNASLTTDGTIKCLWLSWKRPYALIRGSSPYRPINNNSEIITSMWFYWSWDKTTYLFLIGPTSNWLLIYIDNHWDLYAKVGNQDSMFSNSNFVAWWNCITCWTALNDYLEVIPNWTRMGAQTRYPTATFGTQELYVGGDKKNAYPPTYVSDVIVEYSTDWYPDYSKWITYYNNSKSYYWL